MKGEIQMIKNTFTGTHKAYQVYEYLQRNGNEFFDVLATKFGEDAVIELINDGCIEEALLHKNKLIYIS
jgi:hypothetical protein